MTSWSRGPPGPILSVWFVASGKRYEFEDVPPETFAEFRGPGRCCRPRRGVLRALSRHRRFRRLTTTPRRSPRHS
ncbi:MAG: KTSC domain-containing protein [Mesorhizobium sp.]|nr:MAG: KTSC domain-containing protein [Mesorhizobium sp.]TIL99625.1 MAG: KTSC domain-containing protein [Mesorhizobium sp.]